MILALALCAGLFLADVDARVAQYNIRAYQSGRLQTVDVEYLDRLSMGAVPYIEELTADADEAVAEGAREILECYYYNEDTDWRHWNITTARAVEILEKYQPQEEAE